MSAPRTTGTTPTAKRSDPLPPISARGWRFVGVLTYGAACVFAVITPDKGTPTNHTIGMMIAGAMFAVMGTTFFLGASIIAHIERNRSNSDNRR